MITFKNVSFKYAGRSDLSVQEVSFSVPRGQCVLVTGRTGCGKSTLLKMLGGIIPHESAGGMRGLVVVNGIETRTSSLPYISQYVGMVFQSPDDQLFCNTVRDEISFGPENLGLPPAEITKRVGEALAQVGLEGFEERQTARLSGGQKQRVAIASQLAMGPVVLALDEPVSQLDPAGTAEIVRCLDDLKQRGITIVLVEHRVDDVIGIVDRIMVMDQGRVVLDIDRKDLPAHTGIFKTLGLKVPDAVQIAGAVCHEWASEWTGNLIDEVIKLKPSKQGFRYESPAGNNGTKKRRVASLRDISFAYRGAGEPSLKGVSLEIYSGDIIAIMGQNGSGKSTLLSILSGLNQPVAGSAEMNGLSSLKGRRHGNSGRVGMVFQNPDLQLFEDSVWVELEFSQKNLGVDKVVRMARNRSLVAMLRLEGLERIPPHALSKGQRLRVVIGAVLAMDPRLLLLDEPTTGQNEENICNLIRIIRNEAGIEAVVFCTHDFETAVRFSNRVLLMKDGCVVADGPAREVLGSEEALKDAGLLPSLSFMLSRKSGISPPALTVEEFIGVVNGV
ncbi:MAG: energy-coupling factor transporter ATPase [Nitrospirota bacterium]|nr:energy-coupling factor transporter ATPase [Nitrospirota bacterium]